MHQRSRRLTFQQAAQAILQYSDGSDDLDNYNVEELITTATDDGFHPHANESGDQIEIEEGDGEIEVFHEIIMRFISKLCYLLSIKIVL